MLYFNCLVLAFLSRSSSTRIHTIIIVNCIEPPAPIIISKHAGDLISLGRILSFGCTEECDLTYVKK